MGEMRFLSKKVQTCITPLKLSIKLTLIWFKISFPISFETDFVPEMVI